MTTRGKPINLVALRRALQLFFLGLWFVLFVRAYGLARALVQWLDVPSDLFLRTDPLAGLLSSAAARSFSQEAVFWVAIIGLTLILGRFFCGWVCPLGTLLDMSDHAEKRIGGRKALRKNRPDDFRRRMHWKYLLLAGLLVSAVFSVSLAGLFDPLCIMVRSFTFAVWPFLSRVEQSVTGRLSIFGYGGTQPHLFELALVSLAVFVAIFALNRLSRRYWCRNLCPLGALLGASSRISPVKLTVDQGACTSCLTCCATCKMGAIDFPRRRAAVTMYRKDECVQCFACVKACPEQCFSIGFTGSFWKESAVSPPARPDPAMLRPENGAGLLTRRETLGALVCGAAAAALVGIDPRSTVKKKLALVRPPLARANEREFLDLCIRCGQCMQACPSNTLQPARLQAGPEGLLTPVLTPEIAGCVADCSACGQVCPTNAIVPFDADDKKNVKQGTAKLELNRCIGWTQNEDCNACVKTCPSQAIKVVRHDGVYKPKTIRFDECMGCGLCTA
ncbi:MAG: 4Fe-4S binding protein, partial [Chitinivibrionales bacterium]|nr:4Fe-4S binding protein [Chitinivibrionales bacterium]